MTDILADILILGAGAVLVLTAFSIAGEQLRLRIAPRSHPAVETFVTRVNSWWAMVVLFTLALLAGSWGVTALFLFASFAALREFVTYSDTGQGDHTALAVAFFVILPAQYVLIGLGEGQLFTLLVPVYAFLALPVISVLRGDTQKFLARVSEVQWGLMICVYGLSHVPALLTLPESGGRGVLLIAFLVIVVQSADLFDFWIGRKYGQRRIAPAIAPRTWEGFAGAVAGAAVLGAALSWLTPFGIAGAAGVAAVTAGSGLLGALTLKAIKRDKGVRDWSHLIPGQGGVLDQLDSVIFAAPLFLHLTALMA